MANPSQTRDNSQSSDQRRNDEQENRQNSGARPSSADNRDDESMSTAGDTALGKGSKTGVRKDEKEASDNYDPNVS